MHRKVERKAKFTNAIFATLLQRDLKLSPTTHIHKSYIRILKLSYRYRGVSERYVTTYMSDRRTIGDKLVLSSLIILLLTMSQCAWKAQTKVKLPNDILGISVGMSKGEAEKHLNEIAKFERDERKRQQIWRLKNDPHFSKLGIGYDEEYRVRYITLFVDAAIATERIRFTDVGDLSKAKAEIVAPHYRYIWEVPSIDGKPAYTLNIYGDNPEFVTIYSLSGKATVSQKEEEE